MNQTVPAEALAASAPLAAGFAVKSGYLQALRLVERLNRRLLEVIKSEFERRGGDEINAVQALLLYNIGDQELTAKELRARGYYLGSNASYNVKKLVETGFLHYARSATDRRAVRISLTERGHAVHDVVRDLYDRHAGSIEAMSGLSQLDFEGVNRSLKRLERFWTDQIRLGL